MTVYIYNDHKRVIICFTCIDSVGGSEFKALYLKEYGNG